MKQLSEYAEIHDFWADLKTGPANELIRLNGMGMYNSSYSDDKFMAYSDDHETIARLKVKQNMPTALRVSEKIDDAHGYSVAELVFHATGLRVLNYSEYPVDSWGDPIPGEAKVTEWSSHERYATLTASGYPQTRKMGLHIVRASDIPEVQQLLLDSGVVLLEKREVEI